MSHKILKDASEVNNPHDIISEMTNDFSKKVIMDFQETEEKFIFTSIEPFIKSVTNLEISKEELVRAISLIRLQKEASIHYGAMISNDWNTAVRQMHELRNAYDKGRADAERDFQNSDYWNDYLSKVLSDERERILEHQTIIYDLDGIGHKVVLVKDIKEEKDEDSEH